MICSLAIKFDIYLVYTIGLYSNFLDMKLSKKYKINRNSPISYYFYLLLVYIIITIFNTKETSGGGLISQLVAGVIIVYCLINLLFGKHEVSSLGKPLYKILSLFLVFIIIRVVIFFLTDFNLAIKSVRFSSTIIFWVASFLFFIKKNSQIDQYSFSYFVKLLIPLLFICYLYSIYLGNTYFSSINKIGAVNAAGSAYTLVPLIILILKGKTKFFGYFICLIICAWSQKRQCLLGFALVSLFLIKDLYLAYFKTFKFSGIIILLFVFIFSSTIFTTIFSGILERQQYLEEHFESSDSGREELRDYALTGFLDAPLSDIVWGGGPGTGGRYIESKLGFFNMPHCGFIEILCDYGLVGFILYFLFFIQIIKLSFKFPRNSISRRLLLGILFAWLMVNIFSHAGNVWITLFCISISCIICYNFVLNDELFSKKL